MLRFAAVLGAAFLLTGPVLAQPCATIEFIKLEAAKIPNMIFTEIDEASTARFVKTLQVANDGFASMKASRIGIFHKPGSVNVVITTFDEKGCADQNWPVPTAYFFAILNDKGI
jgi:hypothetical protein